MAAEEERVKRPPNAWILFRTYYGGTQPVYPDGTRIPQNQISTVASKIWNKFTESQRRPWEEQADQAKVAHMAAHPNWRYRPRSKALKEQQKLEERLAKAAAREEAKRAKQAAKRAASGTHSNAGGVKRSPSRRLSPATVAASPYPYPCVSPLPGISLANFGPSPPASAASSPMVAPLSLPASAAAEQSPAATLVGTPDQPKYPVLALDSHFSNTSTTTITTTTNTPSLTINDTNDNTNTNTNTGGPAAPVDPGTAIGTPADSQDALALELDFFATHFVDATAADGNLLNGGDFGMGAGGMGVGGEEWGMSNNQLGLMQNSNLSFPLDPAVLGDLSGWAAAQFAPDLKTDTTSPDLGSAANTNTLTSGSPNSNGTSTNTNGASTTPETSFELPFVFNMDGSGALGLGLGVGLGFDAGMDLNFGMGANMGMDMGLGMGDMNMAGMNMGAAINRVMGLNLEMTIGAPVAPPGGANANAYYNQNPYASVGGGNFGGFDFGAVDAQFGDADAGGEWAHSVGFDAYVDMIDSDAGEGRVKEEQEANEPHARSQPEIHVVDDDDDAPASVSRSASFTAPAPNFSRLSSNSNLTTSHRPSPSPDSYASPSAYALQPVENHVDTPHSRASSSASVSSSGLSYVSAASTPHTHGSESSNASASRNAGGGGGGYAPPKGAGNGNRRVAASFKAPPAVVRTASLGWVPKAKPRAGGAA